jgi:hypothetical protein
MKKLLVLATLLLLTIPAKSFASFGYYRTVTVDHTKVANTVTENYTNFTIVATTTLATLATVANSGHVQNSNGFDVGFYSNADCSTGKLKWEQERYVATTGEVIYWIRMENSVRLSTTTDTTIYMCYGDSSISTDQTDKNNSWNTAYTGVWHLPDGTSLTANDSTVSGHNGTVGGSVVASSTSKASQIDGSAWYTTSTDNISMGNVTDYNFDKGNTFSLSTWVNFSTVTGLNTCLMCKINSGGAFNGYSIDLNASQLRFVIENTNVTNAINVHGGTTLVKNKWYHIVATYDGSSNASGAKLYLNGVAETMTTTSNTLSTAITNTFNFELGNRDGNSQPLKGTMDESRVNNTTLTADWIKTMYNAESSNATFLTIGSENTISSGTPPTPRFINMCQLNLNSQLIIN